MNEKELNELQDPGSWDEDSLSIHEPSKPRRVIVSVAFSREAFERIAQAAESQNKPTSTYIREAALASVAPARVAAAEWRGHGVIAGTMSSTAMEASLTGTSGRAEEIQVPS